MEKINGHGAYAQYRVKMLFPGDYGADGKDRQERDPITQQPDKHTLAVVQVSIRIGISSIENKRTQFLTGNKYPAAQKSCQYTQPGGESFPMGPDCSEPVFLEIITCQKKRIKKGNISAFTARI